MTTIIHKSTCLWQTTWILLVCANIAFAQRKYIELIGTVEDSKTGKSVQNALVVVSGNHQKMPTDVFGRFYFGFPSEMANKVISIEVSHSQYQSKPIYQKLYETNQPLKIKLLRKTSLPRVPALPSLLKSALKNRDKEIRYVHHFLDSSDKKILTIAALSGFGKTTLARAAIEKAREKNTPIFWHNCQADDDLGKIYLELNSVLQLNLQEVWKDRKNAEDYKIRQLTAALNRKCVLVFDGVEILLDSLSRKLKKPDIGLLFDHLIQDEHRAKIILTSDEVPTIYNDRLPQVSDILKLEGLSEKHSIALLKDRGMRDDIEILREIYRRVDGHPQALEIFASLVSQGRNARDLLAESARTAKEYREKLFAKSLERLTPQEKTLLAKISVYRTPIPLQAISAIDSILIKDNSSVDNLIAKSWLKLDHNFYQLQSIARSFVTELIPSNQIAEAHHHAAIWYEKVYGNYPEQNATTLNDLQYQEELFFHFYTAANMGYKEVDFVNAAKVANNLFSPLLRLGFYKRTLDYLYSVENKLSHFAEKEVKLVRAEALDNIGRVYFEMGSFDSSLVFHAKAITMRKELEDMNGLAASFNNIGSVYSERGKYTQAISYFTKSKELSDSLDNIRELAISYNNLGTAFLSQGYSRKALEHFQKSLRLWDQAQGQAEWAKTYGNIGYAYYELRDYDNATTCFDSSLKILQGMNDMKSVGGIFNNKGLLKKNQSDYRVALDNYGRYLAISDSTGDQTGIARAYHNIGMVYNALDDYDKALSYINKSLEIRQMQRDLDGIATNYIGIGSVASNRGDFKKAVNYFKESLAIADSIHSLSLLQSNFKHLAEVYLDRGVYDSARVFYEKSLALSDSMEDKSVRCASLNGIGLVEYRRGNHKKALAYHESCLTVTRELGDSSGVASLYNNIANVYKEWSRYDHALTYFRKALSIQAQLGRKSELAKVYRNLGVTFREWSKFDSSLYYYNKSLFLSESIGDSNGIALATFLLGQYYRLKRENEKAVNRFEKVLKYYERTQSWDDLGAILNEYAQLYSVRGDTQKAFSYSRKSLQIALQAGSLTKIASGYNNIGGFYRDIGDVANALAYYQLAKAINDSIGDRDAYSSNLNNIATFFADRSMPDSALFYYHLALGIRKQIGNWASVALTYSNIAGVFNIKRDSSAIEYAKLAITMFDSLGLTSKAGNTYNTLGSAYSNKRNNAEALSAFKKGKLLAERSEDKATLARIYNNMGSIFFRQQNFKKAIAFFDSSLAFALPAGLTIIYGRTYINQATAYSNIGELKKSATIFEKSIPVLTKNKDRIGLMGSYINLSSLQSAIGEYSKALDNGKKGLALAASIVDAIGVARSYVRLGLVWFSIGEYQDAIKYLKMGLSYSDSIKYRDSRASIFNSLGRIYFVEGRLETADSLFNIALSAANTSRDVREAFRTKLNISKLNIERKSYQTALDSLLKYLSFFDSSEWKTFRAEAYRLIGEVYLGMTDTDKALGYMNKGLFIADSCGMRPEKALCLYNIGNVHQNNRRYFEAINNFELARALLDSIGNPLRLAETYQKLGECHYALGDSLEPVTTIIKFVDDIIASSNPMPNFVKLSIFPLSWLYYQTSEIYLLKSKLIFNKLNLSRRSATVEKSLGLVRPKLNRY